MSDIIPSTPIELKDPKTMVVFSEQKLSQDFFFGAIGGVALGLAAEYAEAVGLSFLNAVSSASGAFAPSVAKSVQPPHLVYAASGEVGGAFGYPLLAMAARWAILRRRRHNWQRALNSIDKGFSDLLSDDKPTQKADN